MARTFDSDHGLLGLVERILKKPGEQKPATTALKPDGPEPDQFEPPVQVTSAPALLEPQLSAEDGGARTASELAEIILRAVKAMDGCPKQGLEVVVYGSRPWNAMLHIAPAAGPVPDAALWRARVRDMACVLRGQYDLVD